ncbi:hypothetical protein [Halovivax sp.]|uniref:hypothetical protein n=1 Tax=Halovivax sp. TaxID=1935978 RepID=UPI0025C1D338|nr:hypothetical protein [Halovivax sp.]
MRRIYESSAIHRDEDDPFSPGLRGKNDEPQSFRSVPSRMLSHLLVPRGIRHSAISVSVTTPSTEYDRLTRIPFRVEMRNPLPVPITLATDSPLVWTWSVDGIEEASHVALRDPGDERGSLTFSRGERKVVSRTWDQTFRVSESEWEHAEPGEYTIAARVNVDGAEDGALSDDVTVRIRPD